MYAVRSRNKALSLLRAPRVLPRVGAAVRGGGVGPRPSATSLGSARPERPAEVSCEVRGEVRVRVSVNTKRRNAFYGGEPVGLLR